MPNLRDKIGAAIITAVVSVALALGGFVYKANNELTLLRKRCDDLERQSRMFWKYHGWLHWQSNELRHAVGMPPAPNPDLD